jgi:hypothetical protein
MRSRRDGRWGIQAQCAVLTLLWVGGLLAGPAHARRFDGTPEVGTLAYVVTRCSVDAEGIKADQELRVQRGDEEPKTIVHYPLKDLPAGRATALERVVLGAICQRFGEDRAGGGAELAAPINRVVVSPDGRRVVFHVSDDDLPLNGLEDIAPWLDVVDIELPPGTPEGFYVANTDGTELRFLGHKVEIPASEIDYRHSPDPAMWRRGTAGSNIDISPDGRFVTYVDFDREPGSLGDGYLQVMMLDVFTGERSQLTELVTDTCRPYFGTLEVSSPRFRDRNTLWFRRYVPACPGEDCDLAKGNYAVQLCVVRTNGSRLRCRERVPRFGGVLVTSDPTLSILGKRRSLFSVPVAPEEGARPAISEIFIGRGRNSLQLTNFGDSSTRPRFMMPNRRRVFFTSGADPLGTNPGNRCELFSIGFNGGGLRQITRFNHDPAIPPGEGSACVDSGKPGCAIGTTRHDPHTNAVVFMSNCDILGTGVWGEQAFAMWPDGTGIRQLTHARGCQGLCRFRPGAPDDTSVELPGFLSYAPRHPEQR